MFQLHHDLKEESGKLSQKLEEEFFNGLKDLLKVPKPVNLKSGPTFEEIKEALNTIDWTGEAVKTQKNRKKGSTEFFNPKSWGKWEENPFRHFYSKESDFTSAISSLQSNFMWTHLAQQTQREYRHRWGPGPQWQSQYDAVNKRIEAAKASANSHIVDVVAKFLLMHMGQSQ